MQDIVDDYRARGFNVSPFSPAELEEACVALEARGGFGGRWPIRPPQEAVSVRSDRKEPGEHVSPTYHRVYAAHHEFAAQLNGLFKAHGEDWLREEAISHDSPAFVWYLTIRPWESNPAYLLPLVLWAVRADTHWSRVAANRLRVWPRGILDRDLANCCEEIAAKLSAREARLLAALVTEIGLEHSIRCLVAWASKHSDRQWRELASEYDGVENDPTRWCRGAEINVPR